MAALIMKCFGNNCTFLMMTWIRNIETCFWILVFFLDSLKISTIFHMWSEDDLRPLFGLQNLKDRYLIKWTEDGILYMHEQLRNMGRNIAMEVPMS